MKIYKNYHKHIFNYYFSAFILRNVFSDRQLSTNFKFYKVGMIETKI